MNNLIKIYHNDWIGECLIDENNKQLIRKDIVNEKGKFIKMKNKLIIYWEKWDDDIFYTNDFYNYYLFNDIHEKFSEIYLLEKGNKYKCIIDFKNLDIKFNDKKFKLEIEEKNIYIIEKNIFTKFLKISNNYYVKEKDFNQYFVLNIFFDISKKYIFDKNNHFFYDINNVNDHGKYKLDYNLLKLNYSDERVVNFYTNTFYQETKKYTKLKILYPKSIYYDEKVLFSNISLCNNKVIFTSIYYLYHPWNFDELKIDFPNNKIIKKNNFSYENYESSLMIIIDLLNINEKEKIILKYKEREYEIIIKQIDLPKKNIYAMTLFKDDYDLLNKYLDYYNNLGVECFLFYYNEKIDNNLINKINLINNDKYDIYLFEWNYVYWWKHMNNPKHHHSQTMAINDSLNILKNYSNYILYNDLDEYIKLDSNFNKLIELHQDIDVFQFKCRFCSMGEQKIKYSEFKENYNEDNIILGNFWEKFREKNFIKCKKFNIFGIHEYIENYTSDENINLVDSGFFYHFINFYEKYRPELMSQYIS